MEAITKHLRSAAHRQLGAFVALSLAAAGTQLASAEITQYTDQAAWNAAAGAVTTIGTPNIPAGSLDNHFIDSGLIVGGVAGSPLPKWIAPIWGLPAGTTGFSGGGEIPANFRFTAPVTSFAMEWVWTISIWFDFFLNDVYLESLPWSAPPPSIEQPPFIGFTSTVAFDRVRVGGLGSTEGTYGRAVHFTQIVPAPAAGLVLLCLLPLASRRRG